MSLHTNTSIALTFDVLFGLKAPTVVKSCTTTSASGSIAVATGTNLADNIPAAGYVSGAGVPAGATYTIAGNTVTLGGGATCTASATVNLTFSLYPATLYFALYTAAPNAAGGGTEVTGGSYARVAYANTAANFPATSGQVKSNANAIQWPVSTAAWSTITAWGALDAPTGGTLWFYGTVTSVTMNSGDSIQFAVAQFALSF